MLAAPGAAAKQNEVKHGAPPQRALDTVLVIRVARLEVPFTHPRDGGRPEPVKPPREIARRRAPGDDAVHDGHAIDGAPLLAQRRRVRRRDGEVRVHAVLARRSAGLVGGPLRGVAIGGVGCALRVRAHGRGGRCRRRVAVVQPGASRVRAGPPAHARRGTEPTQRVLVAVALLRVLGLRELPAHEHDEAISEGRPVSEREVVAVREVPRSHMFSYLLGAVQRKAARLGHVLRLDSGIEQMSTVDRPAHLQLHPPPRT